MKIYRFVDISVSIGESRALRRGDEIEFDITGAEAVACVFNEVEGAEITELNLKRMLNQFAQIIKAVPEAEIQKISPEVRTLIRGFLEGSAKRFE